MSVILDALRRKTERLGSGAAKQPRPDSVLATLGYSTTRGRSGWSWKTVLTYGVAAILLGFMAVALPVYLLSPGSGTQEDSTSADASEPVVVPAGRGLTPGASASGVTSQPGPSGAPSVASPSVPAAAQSQSRVTGGEAASPAVPVTPPLPRPARRAAGPETAAPGGATPAPATARPPVVMGRDDQSGPPSDESGSGEAPGTEPPPDHFGLALYYHRAGDFTKALAQYRLALERNDSSAEVHNNLGLLFGDAGDTAAAAEHFQRAITIDPRHVTAQNNLGVSYLREGRMEDASAQFAIALGVDDRNVESLVNLGLVHQAAGRPVEARALLQRAVDLAPRHPGSHYNLAVVADEEGDVQTAIAHYRAFLRFGTVVHPELAPLVRSRLSEIASQ